MTLTWSDLHHSDLSPAQVYDVLRLRQQVFVVEQECPYEDTDGLDLVGGTRHLMATTDDGELAAYARMLAPDHGPACHLGRIVTAPSVRGTGLGRELTRRGIEACRRHWPDAPLEIAAQAHLQEFYGSLGFVTTSEAPYDWDGIMHVDMTWRA